MIRQPRITVTLPWSYLGVKSIQRVASVTSNIKCNGDVSGFKVTATVNDLLKLRIAKESDLFSLRLVSRLRQANLKVNNSRTVHLPGGLSVVEIKTSEPSSLISRIAKKLIDKGPPDLITIYDKEGVGHSRVLGSVVVETSNNMEFNKLSNRQLRLARGLRRADSSKYTALINAIQDIWEKSAEDLTQMVDWDGSDYEAYTVQDLIAGCLDQYLTEDQLEQWENLEPEVQTAILDKAFPEDKVRDSVNRLDRHYDNQTRGASLLERVEAQRSTVEERVDPLDLGVGKKVKLSKLHSGNTIHDLFS